MANTGKTSFTIGDISFTIDDRYRLIGKMGNGSFGTVISAFDHVTQSKVAIKKISVISGDIPEIKSILREIKLLKYFNHENILNICDLMIFPENENFEEVYIVTEFMERDLFKLIYSRTNYSPHHTKYFLYQILRAANFLHSSNVIHRDLKPSNILINKYSDIKICDLGLAKEDHDNAAEKICTMWYRAPELILGASSYSNKIDIWSIGCIFGELLTRKAIFPGKDEIQQILWIYKVLGTPNKEDLGVIQSRSARNYLSQLPRNDSPEWNNLFEGIDEEALDLLSKMLVFNPEKRYSADECLTHKYFEEMNCDDTPIHSSEKFSWPYSKFEETREFLRAAVYEEYENYH